MTPKEKALELVSKMEKGFIHFAGKEIAKQHALISVEEILNALDMTDVSREFWYNVQNEINKL